MYIRVCLYMYVCTYVYMYDVYTHTYTSGSICNIHMCIKWITNKNPLYGIRGAVTLFVHSQMAFKVMCCWVMPEVSGALISHPKSVISPLSSSLQPGQGASCLLPGCQHKFQHAAALVTVVLGACLVSTGCVNNDLTWIAASPASWSLESQGSVGLTFRPFHTLQLWLHTRVD